MQTPRKLQIILVEDSISDAKLTQYALSRLSPAPELLHFEAGEALFRFLDNDGLNTFSVILLDLNLPKMNGLEILKALRTRKNYSQMPIVMFSSSKEEADVLSSYQNGANAYVQKPLNLDDFDMAMEAIVKFWSYANLIPFQIRA